MKKKFYVILILPIVAFLLSSLCMKSNQSFAWNVNFGSKSHQTMITDAYGEARIAYMNEGCDDSC